MRLSELCRVLGTHGLPATVEGEDRPVNAVNTLEDAGAGDVSFLSNSKYIAALETTSASAVIVGDGVSPPDGLPLIRCVEPYAAVTVAIVTLHGYRKHPQWGRSEGATIHSSAVLGENANIAAGATIAADVKIGDNFTIYPGCYVADGVRIGNDCTLYPNVVVYDFCKLGDRVTIHAGSVIGEDGLGYAPRDKRWIKIPQVGIAVVGDDVEIGANCTIDRATLGHTEIGAGTKFGNQIVIGHGTKIGRDCMFVGQVGVAGSSTIGRHVTLGGQVGVGGHLSIGDDVRAGGGSGLHGNVPSGSEVLGSPATNIGRAKRAMLLAQKLPEWVKRIKDLEREVRTLRAQVEGDEKR